jgi:hypothetical protein
MGKSIFVVSVPRKLKCIFDGICSLAVQGMVISAALPGNVGHSEHSLRA